MNTERPASERSLFLAAIELKTPEERAEYLDRACGTDTVLRADVEALLEAHDRLGSDTPLPDLSHFTAAYGLVPDSQPSEQTDDLSALAECGPYRPLELLGEGGMGEVYLAEQQTPVQRQVALKLMKPGMDSRAFLTRFEAERQALALMDHPHIAKVFDAGTSQTGRPYFVMELVRGIPLIQFCDDHRLSIPERLKLFVSVCQAVQHAHQKGIIHRDLKPSNVLVAEYDGVPTPKVIDFGVAKAAGPKLTEATLRTEIGAVVGTLEYMSPEQASFGQLDVDTRSDIYALGVLLYELLTGTTPLDHAQAQEVGILEVLRIIREEEAPRPSNRLSTSAEWESIAARRSMQPAKLRRVVRGELDWIVLKALDKDRSRRYETANGLAMDILRYLDDEPVQAGPPSASYRLRKFIHRNKGAVLAASLVLLVLVGGVIGTTIGFVRAANRAEEERQAKDIAQGRLTQLEKGNDILGSIFLDLDPRAEEKEGKSLRELLGERLEQATAQLDAEAVGDPLMVARLQATLGRSQLGLGYAEKSIVLCEKAHRTLEALLGPNHPDTLATLSDLATAYQELGRLDQAMPLFKEVLARRKETLGPNDPGTLRSMNNLGLAYNRAGQFDKAVPLLEETLARRKEVLVPNHPTTLITMNNLALAYTDAGRLDEALPLLEETLAKRREVYGPADLYTLTSMNNLATAYQKANRHEEALPLYEESFAGRRQALGANHPITLRSMNNLANAYQKVGRLDKAAPLLEEAVEKRRQTLRSNHPSTLNSMHNLAMVYLLMKQSGRAIPLFEEALEGRKAELGLSHVNTLRTMVALGVAYRNVDRIAEALPLLETVYQKGRNHRSFAGIGNTLLTTYVRAGKVDEAITLTAELVADARQRYPADSLALARGLAHWGGMLLQVKAFAVTEPLLRESLEILKNKEPDAWTTFNTMSLLGGVLLGQNQYTQAEALLLEGYEGMKQRENSIPPQGKTRLNEALERLVTLYEQTGQPDQAAKWRKELEAQNMTVK